MNVFKKEKKQTSIFLTAGFPKFESLKKQILYLQDKGIDFIEVGIPFSDPMADGEKIQETSLIAIKNGMNIKSMFEQLNEIKLTIKIPLVIMSYFNPIFTFGFENFLKECQKSNIKHIIIPDISLEVYERNYKLIFEKFEMNMCFLITPNSENHRIIKMSEYSKNGFLYLVSQNSTTGNTSNKEIDKKIIKRYSEIKKLCQNTPLMIGFGIKNKKELKIAHNYADGGIIGTAYLSSISENKEDSFIESVIN
jgi:tryptophan synthase alpha chain